MSSLWPRNSRAVGLLYLLLAMFMGSVGAGLAVLIRTQLSAGEENAILKPETYLSVVTLHGSVMVFGVALPALFAGVGSLTLPRLFDRVRLRWHGLQVCSLVLATLAQGVLLGSLLLESGAAGAGWSSLPPLSAIEATPFDGQDLWLLGMGLVCLSYLSLCLVYARNGSRASAKRSLFLHAWRLASGVGLVCFPVLLAALVLLGLDRHGLGSSFMPAGIVINNEELAFAGGLPFLFRSLFWHLGHPSMLLLSLPALGVALEISAANMQAPLFGVRSTRWAMGCMAAASLLHWGLGIFGARRMAYPDFGPSPLALLGVACLWVVGLNLALSLCRRGLRLSLAMHFVVAMLVTLLCAGMGGLWLAVQVTSERLQASYFAVGHLHLLLGLMSLLAIFAAIHHGFGAIFGRRMDQGLGRLHFWLTFLSLLGAFLLMQFQGFSGLLRHYWDHSHYDFAQRGKELAPIITGLTYLAAGAQSIFFFNLISSVWLGEAVPSEANSKP